MRPWEGSVSPAQWACLNSHSGLATRVAEIGFNAGYSALAFLSGHPGVHVVSFDIGQHHWTSLAKAYIDEHFPGQHDLILGDSWDTVPSYSGEPFDLIFIDGGHDYATAAADLRHMRRLAVLGAILIIDDQDPSQPWGIGPSRAWSDAVRARRVIEIERYRDEEATPPRAWVMGAYA